MIVCAFLSTNNNNNEIENTSSYHNQIPSIFYPSTPQRYTLDHYTNVSNSLPHLHQPYLRQRFHIGTQVSNNWDPSLDHPKQRCDWIQEEREESHFHPNNVPGGTFGPPTSLPTPPSPHLHQPYLQQNFHNGTQVRNNWVPSSDHPKQRRDWIQEEIEEFHFQPNNVPQGTFGAPTSLPTPQSPHLHQPYLRQSFHNGTQVRNNWVPSSNHPKRRRDWIQEERDESHLQPNNVPRGTFGPPTSLPTPPSPHLHQPYLRQSFHNGTQVSNNWDPSSDHPKQRRDWIQEEREESHFQPNNVPRGTFGAPTSLPTPPPPLQTSSTLPSYQSPQSSLPSLKAKAPKPMFPIKTSSFNSFDESMSSSSDSSFSTVLPPPLPPMFPVKTSSFNSFDESMSSSSDSSFSAVLPPPLPPFEILPAKFKELKDYILINSYGSSSCGSPDSRDGRDSQTMRNRSPDVNAKAGAFITKIKAGFEKKKKNEEGLI
ncbi:hypothetical protein FCV25MIE_29896 [Fagus crenata]